MNNYAFKQYPPQDVIVEGGRIVREGTLEEVIEYGQKIEGQKLPFYLTRPTSWRHLVVGIYSRGAMDYSLKEADKTLATAPLFAFLEITLLLSGRRLPRTWVEEAIDIASGGTRETDVYEALCNGTIAKRTIHTWLTSEFEHLQIAGVCTCAARTDLPADFYDLCGKYEVVSGPFTQKDCWLNAKIEKAFENKEIARTSRTPNAIASCF